jgi:Histidine kinase-, DNA gyrase B-, and HSP90-like ATPase
MAPKQNENLIDASPTKDFFISMLVRDIELMDAIADLVDNCVDGARRSRPKGNYDGLWVRVETTAQHFRIADNCGGIPVDLARNYAFRFGRAAGMTPTKHSVGQFGIGMKRALFKLGKKFTVVSATNSSRFKVDVDVEKWRKDGQDNASGNGTVDEKQDRWTFEFDELEENIRVPAVDVGTIITVTSLNSGVESEFELENFQTKMIRTLEAKHQISIDGGLAVTLNKVPLKFKPAELLQSADLKPAYKELPPQGDKRKPVTVKLYVGLAESNPDGGGWYVFCNGRQVLQADQTSRTGWGENQGTTIPKYHNQYARFRGYAFFDSDDAGALPWNTAKTDVALDSPLFQSTRQQMITMTRPVIDFLNKLKQENDIKEQTGKTPLLDQVQGAKPVDLEAVKPQPLFVTRKVAPLPLPPQTKLISYRKGIDQVSKAKKVLKASSLKEVGEKTFDYFYNIECKG